MYLCPKIHLCAKRESKIIIPHKKMGLSFSIGTFLRNYDVTYRKLSYVLIYPPLHKNEKIEREIIQWRLLMKYERKRDKRKENNSTKTKLKIEMKNERKKKACKILWFNNSKKPIWTILTSEIKYNFLNTLKNIKIKFTPT